MQVQMQASKVRKRVRSACERCRRQKLKCDQERPCSLCLRANKSCISQASQGRNSHVQAHQPRHSIVSPGGREPSDEQVFPRNQTGVSLGDRAVVSPSTTASITAGSFIAPVSSLEAARDVLEQSGAEALLQSQTSTFPGSTTNPRGIPTSDILPLKVSLPSKEVLDHIIDTYLRAVHWFMLLFHERSFRRRYERFLVTGIRCKADSRFYQLLLVVCVLGCQYSSQAESPKDALDLAEFQKQALKHLENQMMSICEESELISIQICTLLGSFYLYTGRPNLGFVVLGSGIRCAHALGLHKEHSWPHLADEDADERRRVWWALFIFDRFASIVYGHPCGIREGEFAVDVPRNLDDSSTTHEYGTVMSTPDGGSEGVTHFTYIAFKIELYKLSSSILSDLYFRPSADLDTITRTVRELDGRLCSWQQRLPPELRLDEFRSRTDEDSPENKIFLLQALTLQVAYDNILILLHRPLLTRPPARPRNHGDVQAQYSNAHEARLESGSINIPSSTYDYSRDRCLESASRSAGLCDMKNSLSAARGTHALAYVGINLFTAGTVLCTVALASPLSPAAQQAKSSIRKILVTCDLLKNDTPVALQAKQVLTHLVRVVLNKELAALTSMESTNLYTSRQVSPVNGVMSGQEDRRGIESLELPSPLPAANCPPPMGGNSDGIASQTFSTTEDAGPGFTDDTGSSSTFDLDLIMGVSSLQNTLFPPNPTQSARNCGGEPVWADDFVNGAEMPGNRPASRPLGQAWLWEPGLWNLDPFHDQ